MIGLLGRKPIARCAVRMRKGGYEFIRDVGLQVEKGELSDLALAYPLMRCFGFLEIDRPQSSLSSSILIHTSPLLHPHPHLQPPSTIANPLPIPTPALHPPLHHSPTINIHLTRTHRATTDILSARNSPTAFPHYPIHRSSDNDKDTVCCLATLVFSIQHIACGRIGAGVCG